MRIVDANKCHINVCDLVTLSKALSDNYKLDINCGHVEMCGFTEYYFQKKKCIPEPPIPLGKKEYKIRFLDSQAVCSLVEEGNKTAIKFRNYICSILDTDISYAIKAVNLICKLIEITTTTTTLPTTTIAVTTSTSTSSTTTTTTTLIPTTSTTTTTQRIQRFLAKFEAYICKLIQVNDTTTTTTTLVDWHPITSTSTTTSTTSTTTTTVDPNLPTTTTTTSAPVITNCSEFSALYNWYAAVDSRNIAPIGFHVPTQTEWEILLNSLDTFDPVTNSWYFLGGKFKETGLTHWIEPNVGATNEYQFNARGGGYREYDGSFIQLKHTCPLLASTEQYGVAYVVYTCEFTNTIMSLGNAYKTVGTSIRFIADSGTPTTATDYDGNIYPCITIGSQTWTASSFNGKRYRNGDWIKGFDNGIYTPISNEDWSSLETGGMSYYEHDACLPTDVSTTTTTLPVTTDISTTSTTTTTEQPCGISINVRMNQSEMPEFDLVAASLIKNDNPDQYELTISYKVWVATTFAECQTSKIEFDIYKEDGTYLTTVSHIFNSQDINVFNKPVSTITDLFIFDPFLFILNVVNGTGDGDYKEGRTIAVVATEPSGQYFDSWTDVDNVLSSKSIINPNAVMPAKDVIVTANFLPFLDLTVNDGIIIPGQFVSGNYGRLYNWYVGTDARNIGASGWRVPTVTEIQALNAALGGSSVAGGKLKETGLTYWQTPNVGATNESKWNGRGSGRRTEVFSNLNLNGHIWSTDNNAFIYYLYSHYGYTSISGEFKYTGISIRLIKTDSTDPGFYQGNDGKIYRTCKIGNQVWIADNLAETKFRDGSLIPIVTDGTAWVNLTTSGMCSYNNNDANI